MFSVTLQYKPLGAKTEGFLSAARASITEEAPGISFALSGLTCHLPDLVTIWPPITIAVTDDGQTPLITKLDNVVQPLPHGFIARPHVPGPTVHSQVPYTRSEYSGRQVQCVGLSG